MDFTLGEDLALIRDAARDLADKEIAPRAAEADRSGTFVWEQFRKAGELGFAGMLVPEAYGGSALGSVALSLALIELSRACASTGVTLSVHNSLATGALVEFGSEEQKRRFLPAMAAGEVLGAYSLSEANSGSDAASLKAAAVRSGDGWVLNGTKLWVTSGSHAGTFIVFFRTNSNADKPHHGISAFIVPRDTLGFTVGKAEKKMGLKGSSTNELVFEDARLPAGLMLGTEGQGFEIAMNLLHGGRVGIAAQAVGIARACLAASVRYSGERVQFGKPIREFQAVQWKLAEMRTRIEASRLLVLQAAWLKDNGQPHVAECSMAKLFATRTANYCATEAVQIHGGAGYTAEFPVERYFRDARATEIYEGTTEIQKLVIARSLLRNGA
jgi:alkylation response protein AidB-like acyl-CoA dehydrogenase